ncbi:CCA tRNA nucleotidyltransferase [Candidatus Woesearchaeota archaeon]|nr:CCA tRNA nucleotidyltransferase [Candidatus Woesearchaeota archaeon]
MKFIDSVIKQIVPGKGLVEKADSIVALIRKELIKLKINAEPVLGGSLAKGTNLKGDFDVDIFVRFDLEYKDKDLSKILGKALKNFKCQLVHGSRDYYQFKYKNLKVEVVPVLRIANAAQAVNVTDVSPLHAMWVKKNIKTLADDVMLAKRFCKAQGVYGAESYINGFSGYMLEILVIHYGGFVKMLKAVSNWKPKMVIDIANHYKNKQQVFSKLNAAKILSPLIVIDPVQKDRNAAAALNLETFCKFIHVARKFMYAPSKDFFTKPVFSLNLLRGRARKFGVESVFLKIKPLEGKDDIVGSKILKAFNYIRKQIEMAEFSVLDSGWEWNDHVYFWYLIYPKQLPSYKKHPGPLVFSSEQHIKKFLIKHKETIVEGSRIFAIVKRAYKNPSDLIKFLIKDSYLKEKVNSIRLI